jgi:hypothetical protein
MFVHVTHSIDIRWLTRISQIQDIVVGNKTLAEINSKPPAAADIVQMLLAEEEMEGGGDSYATSTSGFGMSSAGFMGGTSALFAADEGDDFFGQSMPAQAQVEESVVEDVTAVVPRSGDGPRSWSWRKG